MLYVKQLYKKNEYNCKQLFSEENKISKKKKLYEHSGETKPEVTFFLAGGCVQRFGISPINLGRNCNFFFFSSMIALIFFSKIMIYIVITGNAFRCSCSISYFKMMFPDAFFFFFTLAGVQAFLFIKNSNNVHGIKNLFFIHLFLINRHFAVWSC